MQEARGKADAVCLHEGSAELQSSMTQLLPLASAIIANHAVDRAEFFPLRFVRYPD